MTNRRLLRKLSDSLFSDEAEIEAFETALLEPSYSDSCILWVKERPKEFPFPLHEPQPWQANFIDILEGDARPGAHELHKQGAYYVLDASSAFAASVLQEISNDNIEVVADLCASPGGKAVFAHALFKPSLMLCNEVIGKRSAALISNIKRLGLENTFVTSSDVKYLSESGERSFDLVVVDAPCSGQSLIAKGLKSPGCFHPATINKNSNRQKRILANAAKMVAPGGFLAYMTCTYSKQENEDVLKWLLKKFSDLRAIEVSTLGEYKSPYADFPCYRLFPHRSKGAGAFTALIQRVSDGAKQSPDLAKFRVLWP